MEGCRANELVEIDEFIAYQIQSLNALGFETDCCCAGHILFARYYEQIEDVTKKYLSDGLEYKRFENGLPNELRWELRFKDSYVEEQIGIPPDYRLITEFVDELNKLIARLEVAHG